MGSPMPSRRISLFSLPPSPLILANRSAASVASSTGGSRTHRQSRRFELRRFSICVPCHVVEASPMGFEPTISCVTGRRALRCSARTLCLSVAQVGVEPGTAPRVVASLVLSQDGLPIAYRAGFRQFMPAAALAISAPIFLATAGINWLIRDEKSRG